MSEHTELTKEMRVIAEELMGRWGYDSVNQREFDNTGDKQDAIKALCLLFPNASEDQLTLMVSMTHGRCEPGEIREIRD